MAAGPIAWSAALGGVVLALLVGGVRPSWAARASATAAAVVAVAVSAAWSAGAEHVIDVRWMPVLGGRLHLRLDALAAPLALFTAAVAVPILTFTEAYLPAHLSRHGRAIREQSRFCRLMLAFLASMVLLLLAQDLVILFVALELTALTSFFLIEFDRERAQARQAAVLALVVTVAGSLLFLTGALLVSAETGSTSIEVLSAVPKDSISALAVACLVIGVLGKSAQVPFHFWLPRAMVAPTPVSAYLHSATLVASGVFVLQRIRPVLEAAPDVLAALQWVGFASVALGASLALVSDGLKHILAYSTIAQYGYVLVLLSVGGDEGLVGAAWFIVAHGLAKAALFLTAGAVTSATGIERLSEAGGLWRNMPWLAVSGGVAAAGLAGLPLTAGYFKDELFFAATAHHGPLQASLATMAASLTVAYAGRFWLRLFAGRPRRPPAGQPDPLLTVPVAVLAAAIVVGGLWTQGIDSAFSPAGALIGGTPVSVDLAYHLDGRPSMWMALVAWMAGALLLIPWVAWERGLARTASAIGSRLGPAAWADRLGSGARRASDALYRLELRDLRDRLTVVLVLSAVLVAMGIVGRGFAGASVGSLEWDSLPLAAGLVVTATAAIAAAAATRHLAVILLLSFVGFGLAVTFALAGAPDVALVVVLIETSLTLLFLALLSQLRPELLARTRRQPQGQVRGPWAALIAGATGTFLAWFALAEAEPKRVAREHILLAEHAHAGDVVTAILADFRGLDTLGEATVLTIAVLGAATISWGRT